MDRPQIEVDLEILQQQRQLREQEELQRIAQELPEATEDVQQKLQQDNPLKNYHPEQQKQLTEALAIEIARSPTGQKIEGNITISNGSLIAFLDKGTPAHVDIQKVLAQHQPELPDGQQKTINPERQKQIDELLNLFNVDNQLKDHFSPKQQALLKEAMVKQLDEHAGDPPKLMALSYDPKKQDLYFVTARNEQQHINPSQYLEQFKEELQAERPPLYKERENQITQLLRQDHGIDNQLLTGFTREDYPPLAKAIARSVHQHTGTPPSIEHLDITAKHIKIELNDGYRLTLDPQAILDGKSAEEYLQKERIPVIAQRGETGESLAKKLDPTDHQAAYGYLLASKQVHLIKGDDGHVIPNIRPDKAYHYDPHEYTEAQKQQYRKVAGEGIATEAKMNQQIDMARAEQARREKEEQQLNVQKQTEQNNLARGSMSEDPYYQKLRQEQKLDPFSYSRHYKAKDNEVVLGMLGSVNLNKLPLPEPVKHWGVELYQATEQKILKQKAAFETGLNMLTGMGSRMAAGVTSIPAAAVYGTEGAVAIQKDIQERYTYTPSASTQEIIQKNIGQPLAPYLRQLEQGIESVRQSNIDTYGLAGTALLFGSAEALSEFVPIKGGKQLTKLFKVGGDDTLTAITKNAIKVGEISNIKHADSGLSFNIKGYAPQSGYAKQPQLKISAIESKVDDMVLQKGVNGKIEVEKHRGLNSIITPEMEKKILWGQRKNPNKNDVVGGHSSSINNRHPNYAVEEAQINFDGTKNIKFTTQFSDGNLSRIKSSTLFPDGWTDAEIIDSIYIVGNSEPIGQRIVEGLTLHRGKVNGVEIDVIKKENEIIAGYPVGGRPTPGFEPIK
ncbi:EndoU domain-containing protein [Neisseria sp. Ec49-e6-T10]|uniref:EndoU domain-containing protein n=1 Tax=Neisseria sp. Ec49-e6-T10 TaxID=3140744 RepID=UPI003EBAB568